jgi:uncharacterized protein (TIGR02145 family)
MKTKQLTIIGMILTGLMVFNCGKEQAFQPDEGLKQIQPFLKLGKGLAVDEIASAKAVATGIGIQDSVTFLFTIDRTNSMLKGILRIPKDVNECDLAIYLYDSDNRKIGQGSYSLTANDFEAGICSTPEIGITSAKPRIDTLYAEDTDVEPNTPICLHASASDSFGGLFAYEWKFGDGTWITTSKGDTTILAPSSVNTLYVCSLRVTDDDNNVSFRAITIRVVIMVTDIDGNIYHAIPIGNQIWTIENLLVTRYNDGTNIETDSNNSNRTWMELTDGGYCFNTFSGIKLSGALYNWYAVNTGKLAPIGWHVPTADEWSELENYLIANGYNYDGTTSGNKIGKALAADTGWYLPDSGVIGVIGNDLHLNNKSGFSAIPTGYRAMDGNVGHTNAYWWSASENDISNAWYRFLFNNCDSLGKSFGNFSKGWGMPVRLVRDD